MGNLISNDKYWITIEIQNLWNAVWVMLMTPFILGPESNTRSRTGFDYTSKHWRRHYRTEEKGWRTQTRGNSVFLECIIIWHN